MATSKTLKFKDLVFHNGINMTARLGSDIESGERIGLEGKGTLFQMAADVTKVDRIPFVSLKGRVDLLQMQHNPKLRSYEALAQAMSWYYNCDIEKEMIDVILFKIVE